MQHAAEQGNAAAAVINPLCLAPPTLQWQCFDACPVHACLPHVARRMAAITPNAKIVVMVRDPVEGLFRCGELEHACTRLHLRHVLHAQGD